MYIILMAWRPSDTVHRQLRSCLTDALYEHCCMYCTVSPAWLDILLTGWYRRIARDIHRTKLAWLFWTYLMRMGCRDNCKQVLKVIRQEAASPPHAYLRNGTHLRTQYTPHLSILFIGQRAVTCPPPPKVPLGIWTIDSLSQHESAR